MAQPDPVGGGASGPPAVLMVRQAGVLALPETVLMGEVWTADAAAPCRPCASSPGWMPSFFAARASSALNQAIGYRSIVADLQPIERHTAASTAYWLRKVIVGLRQAG